VQSVQQNRSHTQGWGRRGGGGVLPDFSPDPIRNLKHTAFVDIKILKIFCGLPFSHNQPLKLSDGWYMGGICTFIALNQT